MRRTYGILSIARRHPHLFYKMLQLARINYARLFAESNNEINRVF